MLYEVITGYAPCPGAWLRPWAYARTISLCRGVGVRVGGSILPASLWEGAPTRHTLTTLAVARMFGQIVPLLTPLAAALAGVALGWWARGRELRAYREGVRDGRGSGCWVRGQVTGRGGPPEGAELPP